MLRYLRKRNTLLSICLAGILFFCSVHFNGFKVAAEEGTDIVLSNPRVNQDGPSEWDTIWFGHYWWDDTDMSGKADREDDMHLMQWRVLSVDEDKIFVVANQCVDFMPYSTKDLMSTWKTSGIRSWLNGYDSNVHFEDIDYTEDNFIDNAFSEEEQSYILETRNTNADNPKYLINGGRDSIDKIFLLSFEEVTNPAYGFSDGYGSSATRMIHKQNSFVQHGGTIPSKYHGAYMSNTKEYYSWWLRTPGNNREYAAFVDSYGTVDLKGERKSWDYLGVRPAMCLKRSVLYSGLCHSGKVVESDNDRYCWSDETKEYVLDNPRIDRELLRTTWDCIWFGRYWQKDTNGDGVADQRDEKSPILWRILEVDGERLFLIADQVLDVKPYNNTCEDVTWETCTLRSWLNGYGSDHNVCGEDYSNNNFLDTAFDSTEQSAILQTKVINEDNSVYSTNGGNDTLDKVYLLSGNEIFYSGYGFSESKEECISRVAEYTVHAQKVNRNISNGMHRTAWWLRTLGIDASKASYVFNGGSVSLYGWDVIDNMASMRPVVHIDLSYSGWSIASPVSVRVEKLSGVTQTPVNETTEKPVNTPTVAPVVIATQEPVNGATEKPVNTPTAAPFALATQEPINTSTAAPIAVETQKPINETTIEKPINIQNTSIPTANKNKLKKPGRVTGVFAFAGKKKMIISWKRQRSIKGYELQYAQDRKKWKRKYLGKFAIDKTINGLKKNKIYYIRIRAYKGTFGKKIYGKWSKTKKIRTK